MATNWDMVASGLGAIGGGLATMLNNPADAAREYTDQVAGVVQPYYQPYIDTGLRSLSTLEQQFNQLLTNPALTMQMLGGSFQQSPGYEYQYQQSMNAQNQAAQAGGLTGGSAHQQQAGATATGQANQDYYNYLNYMMQLYGMGLEGTQGLNQMGYSASTGLSDLLAQNLMNQARLEALSAMNLNSAMGSTAGGIGSVIGGTVDTVTGWF